MKLLTVGLLLLAASVATRSARADQLFGNCVNAVPASSGIQGPCGISDDYNDGFHEYWTYSYWHRMTLMPGETLVARVQPTSGDHVSTVFAYLYDSCQPGAQVGTTLPPTTFVPFPNPGCSVTNTSGVPKTYWMQVYMWATGSTGSMNYNLAVQAPAGVNYCPGAPNSVGSGGTLELSGTNSVSMNNLVFNAASMPANGFALLANGTGPTLTSTPFGDGMLCITGSLQRLYVVPVSGAGSCSVALNIPILPPSAAIVAGDVRYFQLYYRDSAGPLGTGFNLTNALAIPFTP